MFNVQVLIIITKKQTSTFRTYNNRCSNFANVSPSLQRHHQGIQGISTYKCLQEIKVNNAKSNHESEIIKIIKSKTSY